ncbi:MAG: sugar transferase [Gammaproteobacteria bacterium]|nr:sugar transferase [Gammaproteobacteria bacterium]
MTRDSRIRGGTALATRPLNEESQARTPRRSSAAPSFRPHLVHVEPRADVQERGAPPRHRAEVRVSPLREAIKRGMDLAGALAIGMIFLVPIAVIALLLRGEGGPVIYRHRRIGRDGKTFDCLKFRSMFPDAERRLRALLDQHPELEAEWLRDHKLRKDPRITPIGRFLRRTSFDELPQLWNVLRGEMSLVGPRPIVREETIRYGRHLKSYLTVKPGITGLWQVTGRNNTDYRRRVALDVYYIRHRGLRLDLYILLKTTGVVVGGDGAY